MQNKVKVAFYVNMFLMGGIETSLVNYLNGLSPQRYSITLLIGIDMGSNQFFLKNLKSHIKVQYIIQSNFLCSFYQNKHQQQISAINKLIFNIIVKPISQLVYRRNIIKLAKRFDVVIDYALELLSLAKIISCHCKIIGFFHFSLERYYVKNTRKMQLLHTGLIYYKNIIVLNQHMYIEIQEILPEFTSKVSVLYNQLDIEFINKQSKLESKAVSILDSKYTQNYIVSVGRLEESQKDFTTLIKAYAILHKQNLDNLPKLLIVGDGNDAVKLKNLVATLQLEQSIIFTGYTNNPYPLIKNSKLLVLSSKFEGLAMVLVEAMALSVPVIATDCPNGPRDVLVDGHCGKLVPVGNTAQLAQAIADILSNRNNICQTFIKNGKLRINDFDIKINGANLEKLIKP